MVSPPAVSLPIGAVAGELPNRTWSILQPPVCPAQVETCAWAISELKNMDSAMSAAVVSDHRNKLRRGAQPKPIPTPTMLEIEEDAPSILMIALSDRWHLAGGNGREWLPNLLPVLLRVYQTVARPLAQSESRWRGSGRGATPLFGRPSCEACHCEQPCSLSNEEQRQTAAGSTSTACRLSPVMRVWRCTFRYTTAILASSRQ